MTIKIFKCEDKWHTYNVFAPDADAAREICRDRYGIRKNAAGFHVREVPYKTAVRYSKKKRELVHSTVYRYPMGECDDSHYSDVEHYYCGNCHTDLLVAKQDFCPECNAYFIKYEKR